MRQNLLQRGAAFWGLLTIAGAAVLFIIAMIVWASARYPLLQVPIASWYVLVLSGLLVALGALAALFRHRWRRTQGDLEAYQRRPAELPFPAVYGHRHLAQAEYLPLVQTLFRPPPEICCIYLRPLAGGYGGGSALLAELQPQPGAERWPRLFVLKLGGCPAIADESHNYRSYVEVPLSGREALYRQAVWGGVSAIAFEFVGLDPGHDVQTFHEFYQRRSGAESARLIGQIYEPLQRAWYQRGRVEPLDLFVEYGLLASKERLILERVAELVAPDDPYRRVNLSLTEPPWPDLRPAFCPEPSIPWHDPLAFLRTWSAQTLVLPAHRSTVHGDLNARNVLVELDADAKPRVWFIDFSHTGNGLSGARRREAAQAGLPCDEARGHTLRDFGRLEADLKFLLTGLEHEQDLRLALRFELALLDCAVPWRSFPEAPPSGEVSTDERFRKLWQVVSAIRRRASAYLGDPADPRPYYMALLHATLPTVYYQREQFGDEERERQQKRYALLAAGMLCRRLSS